jgi:hypothetical protein
MKLILLLLAIVFPINGKAQDITKNFYVKLSGSSTEFRQELLKVLALKSCVRDPSVSAPTEKPDTRQCHSFRPFDNESLVKGDFFENGSSLLVTVQDKGSSPMNGQQKLPRKFYLEFLQREGVKLRTYMKPGTFSFPSDHFIKSGTAEMSDHQERNG